MPSFTITVSDALLARLKALTDRTNADQGTALTVQQWILLHLKEVAITDDLIAAVETLRQQSERDANDTLQAAARAERDRLLQTL